MAPNQKHPPGLPMDLANMREQGVRNLIAYCLNEAAIIIAEQDYARLVGGIRPRGRPLGIRTGVVR
jgi:hypothetical protein